VDGDGTLVNETRSVDELVVVREFEQPVFPGLQSVGRVERGADKPFHTVINSENFHALEMLLYTCEAQVDVIYIDPPYNTGDRSWKYNNDYVDKNDDYRHSKWLSFMEKRLLIAKRLLRPDNGVLIVTIDEHEVARLALLLEQIFPNYIHTMVTTVINPKGTIRSQFGRVEEYALFVIPNTGENLIAGRLLDVVTATPEADDEVVDNEDAADVDDEVEAVDDDADVSDETEEATTGRDPNFEYQLFRRSGSSSLREDRPNRFFPIYIDEEKRTIVWVGETLPLGQDPSFDHVDGLRPVWPIDSEGNHRVWRWKASRVCEILDGPDDKGRFLELGRFNPALDNWTINLVVPRKLTVKQKTVWWETRHDAGTHGTTLLQKLLGKSRQFSFPKSLYLVRDTLDVVVRNRPDALVLDFFAGSGTTAHAVALLNEVDGGRRRSILVTNNEVESKLAAALIKKNVLPGSSEYEYNGIFWNVTKPRLEAAITGKRRDGKDVPGNYIDKTKLSRGLAENIEFFELTYEDPDRVRLGADFSAVAPLLWMMAGAEGPRIDKITERWAVPKHARYGVLFDADAWPAFVKGVRSNAATTHAFIVTDSDAVFQRVVAELPDTVTPVRLYESYLRSFAINTGAGREV
jgi:adenine-specific DNA-methyltransferase